MNEADKEAILKLFPNASASFLALHGIAPVAPRVRHPQPQQDARSQPLDYHQAQERGAVSGSRRCRVTIVRKGSKLLDVDNLAGGCKPLVDALRYAGYIVNDDPASVELLFKQIKTPKKLQGTEVLIEPLA